MNNQFEKIKAASVEDLEKKIENANHFAESTLSIISDLIHLNIAITQKSLANSNATLQEMLHASSVDILMKNLHEQSEELKETSTEYSRHLASIAHRAQETMSQTTHKNMETLSHKVQNFLDQMREHAPQNSNYIDSMKKNLENINPVYSIFLNTMQDAFNEYQKNWTQLPHTPDSIEKIKKKPAKKKSSR